MQEGLELSFNKSHEVASSVTGLKEEQQIKKFRAF
jgi:hypothetical protein